MKKQGQAKSATPKSARATKVKSDFAKILRGTELLSISLNSANFEINERDPFFDSAASLTPRIKLRSDFTPFEEEGQKYVVALQEVKLEIPNEDDVILVSIECTFELQYSTKHDFTEDFIEEFKHGPMLLQVAPYIRELIQDFTARMSIPPLTLPMVKINLGNQQ